MSCIASLVLAFLFLETAFPLNIVFRLSSYQLGSANVVLAVDFKLTKPLLAEGSITLRPSGPLPPYKADAVTSLLCEGEPNWVSTVPDCIDIQYPAMVQEGTGPYRIRFPDGLSANVQYTLALGGLKNPAKAEIVRDSEAYSSSAKYQRLETNLSSTRFTFSSFRAGIKLDSYEVDTPVLLTAFFIPTQDVIETSSKIRLHLTGLPGTAVLECETLWDSVSVPLPACKPGLVVGEPNANRLYIPSQSLVAGKKYSFSISGLRTRPIEGLTQQNHLSILTGALVRNLKVFGPFYFSLPEGDEPTCDAQEEAPSVIDPPSSDINIVFKKDPDGRVSGTYGGGSNLWIGTYDPLRPLQFDLPYMQDQVAITLCSGTPQHVLMLGLGIGGIPAMFHAAEPSLVVDVVDIDPKVIQQCLEIGHLTLGDKLHIFQDDAAKFVQQKERQGMYDVVIFDVYDGKGIPAAFRKKAFFEGVKRCLTPTGVFSFNLIKNTHGDAYVRQQMKRVFHGARVIKTSSASGNDAPFGWTTEHAAAQHTPETMRAAAANIDKRGLLPFSLEDSLIYLEDL